MVFKKLKVKTTIESGDGYVLKEVPEENVSPELVDALLNYFTHATPTFDDDNGEAYKNAVLSELEKI